MSDPSSESGSDASARKIDRMARQTRELGDAVAEWLELRVALVRAEVEEEVNRRLNEAVRRMIVAAIVGTAGVFVLVTAALALGRWLGHSVWGFAVVSGVLLAVAFLVAATFPQKKLVSLDPSASSDADSTSPSTDHDS